MYMPVIFSLVLFFSGLGFANENSIISQSSKPLINTNMLHERMTIRSRYQSGGSYYLRGELNSFGEDEPINLRDEVVLCEPGDRTFTETIINLIADEDPAESGAIPFDSASFGVDQQAFVGAMQTALESNSNPNAKGRFCKPISDVNVTFNQGVQSDNFCAAGSNLSFIDPYTGRSCSVELDINLKGGSYRYLRSEVISPRSVGLAFAFCDNEGTGAVNLRLVENPASCTSSPESCVNTCTWVGSNICRSSDLPRWGGGMCGSVGSQLIRGDALRVDSIGSFSIDINTGQSYSGYADFQCNLIGESVQWQLINETCGLLVE